MLRPTAQQLLNFVLWEITFVDGGKGRRSIQLPLLRTESVKVKTAEWLLLKQQLDPSWVGWRFGDCTQVTGTAIDFESPSF